MNRRNNPRRNNNRQSKHESNTEKYLKIMALKDQNDLMTPKVPDVIPMKLKSEKVYTFSRSYSLSLSGSGVGPTSISYGASLGTVPDYTDFTTLFDQYRIMQLEVRYIPIYAPGEFPGTISSVIDYDDANTISESQALQYQTLQVTALYQPFYRVLHPRSADIVYNGNVTVAYGQNRGPQWIDVASPDVPHYGLKLALPTITGAPNSIALGNLVFTLTIQCKNPR
jgi:hypothetical protein